MCEHGARNTIYESGVCKHNVEYGTWHVLDTHGPEQLVASPGLLPLHTNACPTKLQDAQYVVGYGQFASNRVYLKVRAGGVNTDNFAGPIYAIHKVVV